MAGGWQGSTRKQRLPSNWNELRLIVQARANGLCQGIMRDGTLCGRPGNQCDHITAGDNHDISNLQWLCEWHHKQKSSREGHAAKAAIRPRYEEKHPGLL